MIVVGPAITKLDTIYYQAQSNSWTFLEVNVGILCACLPTLRQAVAKFFPRIFGIAFSSTTGTKGTRDTSAKRMSYALSPASAKRNSDWIRFDPNHPQFESTYGGATSHPKISNKSDEVLILQGLDEPGRGVKKTSNIGITFEEREISNAKRSFPFPPGPDRPHQMPRLPHYPGREPGDTAAGKAYAGSPDHYQPTSR